VSENERSYSIGTLAGRLVGRVVGGYADGGPVVAGAIAYRVLFSVFPLVIVLTALFGVVVRTTGVQADVIDFVIDNVPLTEDGKQSVRELLEGVTGGKSTLGLVAVVGLVWSASGMMAAIRGALNRAWGVVHARPFVRGKLVDVLLVLAVGVFLLLSTALAVGSRMVTAYASSALERAGIPPGALTWLIGFLVPAVLAFLAVAFLYRVVPATPERPAYRVILPSAAAVGVAFTILQMLFGVYLSSFGNYNAVYGSLGAVIAFLVFVYMSSSLFLLGAHAAAGLPVVVDELERGEGDHGDSGEPGASIGQKVIAVLRGLVAVPPEERDEDRGGPHEGGPDDGDEPQSGDPRAG